MTVIGSNLFSDGVGYTSWEYPFRSSLVGTNEWSEGMYPYPLPGGVIAAFTNKCVDTVSGSWVYWTTYYEDYTGREYPGAGFDAGTYRIETIRFLQG